MHLYDRRQHTVSIIHTKQHGEDESMPFHRKVNAEGASRDSDVYRCQERLL